MTRILDRYIYKEMGPPFLIGVGVFTFFLVIDRIYQLTDLVITKNVPFALVMPLPVDSPLAAVAREEKPEKQLPLRELIKEAESMRLAGQISAPYYVELHKRFALPVAALVFTVMAFPLGIRSQRGGRAVALGLSFGIVVSYYIFYSTMEGLALRGRMPAGIAVWIPNAILATVGLTLLRGSVAGVPPAWLDLFWRVWAKIGERRSGRVAKPLEERRRRRLGRLAGPRASTFIMDRYLIRQYLIYLGIGTGVGAVLIVVVDLLQTLDRFLRSKPPFFTILEHFLYRMPGELYKGLPMIVLIATVFLFLSLTRQRELDALKAAGVSLYRASLPILLVAGVITVLAVVFQETALPDINAKADEVDRVKIRGQLPRHLQRQTQIWYRSSDTRFFRMALLDPVGKSMEGLTLLEISPDFRLVERVDAKTAQWTPEGWQLADGVLRRVGVQNRIASEPFAARMMSMPENIDDFIQVQNAPDTMSFLELRAYVTKLREGGHRVNRYLVQLYSKLSFPLVHVIMALVAIPFALVSPRSGGRAMGIGVAIVIAVGYWIVHSVAIAFAQADLLPAALAAWTANIVFAGIGTALFLSART
jgi:lipopolysaccharide export system permease protein